VVTYWELKWLSSPLQRQGLGWNGRGNWHGPLSATWQADWSTISRFSGSSGAAWSCVSSYEAEIMVQYDGAPAHCWIDGRQWLNATCLGRRIGYRGSIACPQSQDLNPMDSRLCSLSRDYWRFRSKTSTSSDNGRFQHVNGVFERMLCSALSALEWMEASSNTWYSCDAPMVWSFAPFDGDVCLES
jgi:hypothetical protein